MRKILARISILLVLLAIALPQLPSTPARAQGTNLLINGDMATGGYYGLPNNKGQAPNGWQVWATTEAPSSDYHQFLPQVRSAPGAWIQRGGFINWTAGGYQTAGVSVGKTYRFSIYAFQWTCNDNEFSCTGPEGRSSDKSSNMVAKIGIDPTGGTDPTSGNILWGPPAQPWDAYQAITVDAIATGGSMTVFTYSTSTTALFFREILWDDASLVELGEGQGNPLNSGAATTGGEGDGETTVVEPPQTVPFVTPQQARPDGSVVHTVGDGDTFSSIYVAYRSLTTRDAILKLNGWELPPAIISIGDEIKILPPGSVDPATGRVLNPSGGTAAQSTPVATPPPPPTNSTSSTPVATPPPPTNNNSSEDSGGNIGPSTPVIDPDVEKGGSLLPGGASSHFLYPNRRYDNAMLFSTSAQRNATRRARQNQATGTVCLSFFDDQNSDLMKNQNESAVSGAQVMVDKTTHDITTEDGTLCVDDVRTGQITVEATAPAGYGFLSGAKLLVQVYVGHVTNVPFAVVQGVNIPDTPTEVAEPPLTSVDIVPVVSENDDNNGSMLNQLFNNSAYAVFVLAAILGLVSMIVVWSYRR